MLPVGCLRTPKRTRQIAHRTESRCCGVGPTRKARRDLLEQPAVPVWILKRGKREVGTTFRVAPGDARVLYGIVKGAAGVVEDLAHFDAAAAQLLAGGHDVGDD